MRRRGVFVALAPTPPLLRANRQADAEDAAWAKHQNQNQNQHRNRLLIAGRYESGAKRFDEAKSETAYDGTHRMADTTQYGGRKPFQSQHETTSGSYANYRCD